MSTTFQIPSPSLQKLDPSKRVNYTFGLVLGAEEFLQSDAYFLSKHHVENRLLHGYGTLCGLDVLVQTLPTLQVEVTPGWAINPKGQEIHVSQLMCVQIQEWLQANKDALAASLGSMPSTLNLVVVLCYRECKTDVVPIPGEPCRTQADSMAPSRIADSFELMLCLDQLASPPLGSPPYDPTASGGLCLYRPPELEELAARAFGKLLSQLQVSAAGPFLTLQQLELLVRELAQNVGSPPFGSPPFGSPPSGPPYLMRSQDASDFVRAAFRTWITEVRPFISAQQGTGPCCPPPEKCVLVAELAIPLNPGWIASGVTVDDSRRPFLVPTRLLQEIFFEEPGSAIGAPAYVTVAAGFFNISGTAKGPVFNLTATPALNGEFLLQFNGYQNPNTTLGINYIVKGTVQDSLVTGAPRATFEFVRFEATAIRIRIQNTALTALGPDFGFMAEISQIGGGS
jgi:hypothetical protein